MNPDGSAGAPPAGFADWLQTAPGQYLLAWEQEQLDLAVADLFGYNALQLGLPELAGLRANRMPHRWLALPQELAQPGLGAAENENRSAGSGPGCPTAAGVAAAQRQFGGCLAGRLISAEGAGVVDGGATAAAMLPASLQRVALIADPAALPFPAASLDLVLLAHTLELSADPHQVLREVERVLVPEGRVVVCGLNPASLWGLRQTRARLGLKTKADLFLPQVGEFIGPWRLRDWLRLLSFEVESDGYGCYRPAVQTQKWLQRMAWMDRVGPRWWPIFGAAYFTVAVKRVRGMRLLGPAWKPQRVVAAAPVSVANRN